MHPRASCKVGFGLRSRHPDAATGRQPRRRRPLRGARSQGGRGAGGAGPGVPVCARRWGAALSRWRAQPRGGRQMPAGAPAPAHPPRRAGAALRGRPESAAEARAGAAAGYYGAAEAAAYDARARASGAQAELADAALGLAGAGGGGSSLAPGAALSPVGLLLDLGCGSGLSGARVPAPWYWIGVDVSSDLLCLAAERAAHTRSGSLTSAGAGADAAACQGDGDGARTDTPLPRCAGLVRCDLGQGLPFRAGAFDAAISVSVVQVSTRLRARTFTLSRAHLRPADDARFSVAQRASYPGSAQVLLAHARGPRQPTRSMGMQHAVLPCMRGGCTRPRARRASLGPAPQTCGAVPARLQGAAHGAEVLPVQ